MGKKQTTAQRKYGRRGVRISNNPHSEYEEESAYSEEPVYEYSEYEEEPAYSEESVYGYSEYEEEPAFLDESMYEYSEYEEDQFIPEELTNGYSEYEEEPAISEESMHGYSEYDEDSAIPDESMHEYSEYEEEQFIPGESMYEYSEYEEEPIIPVESAGFNELEEYLLEEQEALTVKKRKRKKRIIALVAWFIVIALAGFAGGYVYYELPYRCVKESVTIEAGDACPSVAEFLEWECEDAFFVSGIDESMEFNHVQDYEVTIHLYHQDIATMLHVVDTVPPEVQTRDKTIMFGEPFELEDFVEGIFDVTAYEVSYQEEPEIPGGGIYTIVLEVRDEGGNITEAEALLEVIQDVTPPVIEGVEEITITVGESVSYKRNIVVTDDYDDAVKLEVDNSEVDTDTPGDYRVVYRAADKYGNVAEVETVIHVKELPKVTEPALPTGVPMTEEAVNAEADKLLAAITNPSMSQYEVIRAIYDWCHNKIAYMDGTTRTSWVDGAYAGIVARRGDCYAYAMSAKCLLTRAGITNMDIERVPVGNSIHFWNLVDIGEGWHHFDTCRRADGASFFYLTDAELMAYSEAHVSRSYPNGTHYYDKSLYPEIP